MIIKQCILLQIQNLKTTTKCLKMIYCSPLRSAISSNCDRVTNAVLFRTPLHPVSSLCFFTHSKLENINMPFKLNSVSLYNQFIWTIETMHWEKIGPNDAASENSDENFNWTQFLWKERQTGHFIHSSLLQTGIQINVSQTCNECNQKIILLYIKL